MKTILNDNELSHSVSTSFKKVLFFKNNLEHFHSFQTLNSSRRRFCETFAFSGCKTKLYIY